MAMETLEFIIHPDGRVEEKVTGIIGKSCEEVTAAIEKQLGRVVAQEKTTEYYGQTVTTTTENTTHQQNFSHW